MVFLLSDAGFDLPALMITADELKGRGELRIEQGGHQAMQVVRIGVVARLRRRELSQALGGVRLDAILDHTHLHGGQSQRMQGDEIAAVGEDLLSMGVLVGLEARQGLGLPLMDQRTQLGG
jgi:hypothetical protein